MCKHFKIKNVQKVLGPNISTLYLHLTYKNRPACYYAKNHTDSKSCNTLFQIIGELKESGTAHHAPHMFNCTTQSYQSS